MRAAGGTKIRPRAAPPAAPPRGRPPMGPAWTLPVRARVLVVAGVLVAAAGVFVAVFWVHGVWVPLCAGCDELRKDERLAVRALVVAAGVSWAVGLGSLALLASRPGGVRLGDLLPGGARLGDLRLRGPRPSGLGRRMRVRPRRAAGTGAGPRRGAARAREG